MAVRLTFLHLLLALFLLVGSGGKLAWADREPCAKYSTEADAPLCLPYNVPVTTYWQVRPDQADIEWVYTDEENEDCESFEAIRVFVTLEKSSGDEARGKRITFMDDGLSNRSRDIVKSLFQKLRFLPSANNTEGKPVRFYFALPISCPTQR